MAMGKFEKQFRRKAINAAGEMRDASSTNNCNRQERWNPSHLLYGLLSARLADHYPTLAETIGYGASVATLKVQSESVAVVVSKVIAQVVCGTFFEGRDKSGYSLNVLSFKNSVDLRLEERRQRDINVILEDRSPLSASRCQRLLDEIGGGGSVLLIWYHSEGFLGPEAMAIRTDELELPLIQLRDLQWLGRIATGGIVSVPRDVDLQSLNPAQISAAFAIGISSMECERRIGLVLAPQATEEDRPPPTTLLDLPAFGPATDWGLSLALDLQEYREGRLGWDAVDRGALIEGPPGVGKTTYAKALAATCEVKLFSTSVSEWYAAAHLGETLRTIRQTFTLAAKSAPCIIFIDEIDGIGDRAKLDSRHRDYVTQVINCLLECMDGAAKREGVVVVGACNFPDRVDPALKRPGRLDRQIQIPLPSIPALEAIFQHYLNEDELLSVDLETLATAAHGLTGAEVEQCIRTARRRARREGRGLLLKDLVAEIRAPVDDLSPASWWRIAVHEAGHAFVAVALGLSTSINVQIGRSNFTQFESGHDGMTTRETGLRMVRYILAGRAAEQEIVGDVCAGGGGAENSDLAHATRLIAALEGSLGLGACGHLTWWADADATHRLLMHPRVSLAVEKTLAELHADARRIIRESRDTVIKVANELLKRQRLSGRELTDLIGPIHPSPAASPQTSSETSAT